ncbi:hypothetical protein E5S67_02534 [Microcoleus sp. IPMA8]|uniref:Uncharacterized protein n=1 Tax=Microcoleus asticus IPMA8 TaxID=2563858 RepID=A0ABX2CZD9_9CYAN|nr:hypothetical protein [Microcoleus asticus IPMA8]
MALSPHSEDFRFQTGVETNGKLRAKVESAGPEYSGVVNSNF